MGPNIFCNPLTQLIISAHKVRPNRDIIIPTSFSYLTLFYAGGGIYAPPTTYRQFSPDVLIRGGSKYTQNLSFVITEHIKFHILGIHTNINWICLYRFAFYIAEICSFQKFNIEANIDFMIQNWPLFSQNIVYLFWTLGAGRMLV